MASSDLEVVSVLGGDFRCCNFKVEVVVTVEMVLVIMM